MEKPNKLVWTDLVSDELKEMLFNLKSDNGVVPLGTVDKYAVASSRPLGRG